MISALTPFAVGYGIGAGLMFILITDILTEPREKDKQLRWDGVPQWRIALSRLKRLHWPVVIATPFATGVVVFVFWWLIALLMGVQP